MGKLRVVSVGYEQRTPQELVDLLLEHGVSKLLDVRELPLSRRRGFSKSALADWLHAHGIEYRHIRAAGNPHRHLKADIRACLQAYDEHLTENPEILYEVASEIDSAVAFLCYERQHFDCHRSILLRQLVACGLNADVVEVE